MNNTRHYAIGGLIVQVEADLPITDATFLPKFELFRVHPQPLPKVEGPDNDTVYIHHHFSLPRLSQDLGEEILRHPPWAVYRKGDTWTYLGTSGDNASAYRVALFNRDHTRAHIYHQSDVGFRAGGYHSLTCFPSDLLVLAHVLAERQGCYFHSSGAIIQGQGLLFVGHSEAGKSTMVKMLEGQAEILCDDRNIVRRRPDGFWVYGTWSHGEVPTVSASSAPLRALMFLEKASENRLVLLQDRREIVRRLVACVMKPVRTADWWEKTLDLLEAISRQVYCYRLMFDTSGDVIYTLYDLVRSPADREQPKGQQSFCKVGNPR